MKYLGERIFFFPSLLYSIDSQLSEDNNIWMSCRFYQVDKTSDVAMTWQIFVMFYKSKVARVVTNFITSLTYGWPM